MCQAGQDHVKHSGRSFVAVVGEVETPEEADEQQQFLSRDVLPKHLLRLPCREERVDRSNNGRVPLGGELLVHRGVDGVAETLLDPAVLGQAPQPQAKRLTCGLFREQARHHLDQLGDVAAVHRHDEVIPRGELAVKGAATDSRGARDFGHGGRGLVLERCSCDLENAVTIFYGIAAHEHPSTNGQVSATVDSDPDTCPNSIYFVKVSLAMHEKLDGTVVAITGASSGIGAATAAYLAERGAKVVLGARRRDRLDAVVAEITSAGGDATGIIVDVTRRDDLIRLVDTALERHGRLDVLVSNAGTMAVSPFDEIDQDGWDSMVATHITGLLNGIAAALPVFRRQESGQFVNVGSTAAYVVKAPQGVYAATKTAVKVLSEGLRQESGPDLRVTLVSPGFTDTEGVGKGTAGAVAESFARQRADIAMPPSAIARAIGFAIEQPAGVDISEVVVRPTIQA